LDLQIGIVVDASTPGAYLIVNADDYGYFRCVSKGILDAASRGVVTATGVFANAPHFREHAAWLRDCQALDVGNHLNLTYGVPLTSGFGRKLARWSGRFPGKISLAMGIVTRAISSEDVRSEWRAQIDRCLECGLRVRFLNSHEHVHTLPALFTIAIDLAREYGIAHVRIPSSRLAWNSPAALFRSAVVKILGASARHSVRGEAADFLGLEVSGKLGMPYLERVIPRLRGGRLYELMCHPGQFDPQEVKDPRLLRYHDWAGELRTLLDPAVRALLDDHGVRLVGYRHLEVRDGRLAVRQEAR
jgi:hypothetical protein